MSTYFPFLRGKQNEMFALRTLSRRIANSGGTVYPIIEPVNSNSTTRISIDNFCENNMPFVFVTNPMYGNFKDDGEGLYAALSVDGPLAEYDNFIPALYIRRGTSILEINRFYENYANASFRSAIYLEEPLDDAVKDWCSTEGRIYFHVVRDDKVSQAFIRNIPTARRVMMRDSFNRQPKNSAYPEMEFFTDRNTSIGNPGGMGWGDYSIQGDYYSDDGGPAFTIAIHHVHRADDGESLNVSHFLSDRQETKEDRPGKTMEAMTKLVDNLDNMAPSDTLACDIYRQYVSSQSIPSLGMLKRIAIQHHIEIMLDNE